MDPNIAQPNQPNPVVHIEIKNGRLDVSSNLGDPLKVVQFLLGTMSALLGTMKIQAQEEQHIIQPQGMVIPDIRER